MRIKDEVLSKGSFIIKDGTSTRFWDDTWIGDKPLKDTYPALYNIARDRQATVSKVMSSRPHNISILQTVSNVVLVDGNDYFKWLLTKNGLFTVRSMYLHAVDTHPPFQHKKIWKWKLSLKIKIFIWFLQKGVVLTKDNLAKKNWKESKKCV
jgi:hypothetical protein